MTGTLMETIDRRRRTSDGTVTCSLCGNIIEKGGAYVTDTSSTTGTLIERDICFDCMDSEEHSDAASWLFVIAASVGILALTAWALVG